MKIKTANIRTFSMSDNKLGLKMVEVKTVFTHDGELFFIHRCMGSRSWKISHYQTGMGATKPAPTIAAVKASFDSLTKMGTAAFKKAIESALKEYGAANELPEENG